MTGRETERIDALLDELARARAAEAALAARVRQLRTELAVTRAALAAARSGAAR